MSASIEMLIEHITVAERARKDLGNLDTLKHSIQTVGLLQPIGVKAGGELIFGGRRLEAMRQLGYASIPVRVLSTIPDAMRELQAEMDENLEREPFTAVDAAALRRRMKDLQLPEREEVQRDSLAANREDSGRFGPPAATSQPVAEAVVPPSVDAQIAAATGYSVTTLQRVDRIAEFVHASDPAIAAAATSALARIDMGAPVKPLLDSLINARAVARATEKYPALEHMRAETKHVVRMESYLDGIAASGDAAALEEELAAITAVHGDGSNAASGPTAAQRETGFEINAALAASLQMYARANGTSLLASLAPGLTKATVNSWLALAADMERTAAAITAAFHHESDS